MKAGAIKLILFPTDFSDDSLSSMNFAIEIVKKTGAKLVLLNVVDTPFSFNIENEPEEVGQILEDLIQFSKIKLKKISEKIKKQHSLSVEAHIYTGETTSSIVRAANQFGCDLIIMGTKVNKDLFFKTNSFNIVKNTAIPMLTIGSGAKTNRFKKILFPFNERIMTLRKADGVIQIAKLYRSKVILLGISEANTADKIENITDNMMYIKSILEKNGIECDVHFKSSKNYSKAILDYCNDNKIDLITIANNLPTTLKETVWQAPAQTVMNNAKIPVLTISVNS